MRLIPIILTAACVFAHSRHHAKQLEEDEDTHAFGHPRVFGDKDTHEALFGHSESKAVKMHASEHGAYVRPRYSRDQDELIEDEDYEEEETFLNRIAGGNKRRLQVLISEVTSNN